MDSGIAAVIGALIGTAGSTTTAAVTGVFGRRQARTQISSTRAEWLLDNRRRAYQEFLAAVRAFENAWWALGDAIGFRDGEELFEKVIECYAGLTGTAADVQLLGPDAVADAARRLATHLRDMDAIGTRWFRATDEAAALQDHDGFWAAFGESGTVVEEFWTAARAVLTEPFGAGRRGL